MKAHETMAWTLRRYRIIKVYGKFNKRSILLPEVIAE
jgi:hypothetical protein